MPGTFRGFTRALWSDGSSANQTVSIEIPQDSYLWQVHFSGVILAASFTGLAGARAQLSLQENAQFDLHDQLGIIGEINYELSGIATTTQVAIVHGVERSLDFVPPVFLIRHSKLYLHITQSVTSFPVKAIVNLMI